MQELINTMKSPVLYCIVLYIRLAAVVKRELGQVCQPCGYLSMKIISRPQFVMSSVTLLLFFLYNLTEQTLDVDILSSFVVVGVES